MVAASATEPHLEKKREIIPPSPEAAALGRFGAFPVSYYTGIPQINIPIYELNVGDISLPITLDYHASGIRVDDIASQVGLGWSLNAGGCISVETKGQPDMIPPDYYNGHLTNKPDLRHPSVSFQRYLNRSQSINSVLPREVVIEIASQTNSYDMEPDVYNYNFGGHSGQFVIDDNKKVKFLKNTHGVKADLNTNNREFIFTNNKGVRYIFRDTELTSSISWLWGMNANFKFIEAGYNSSSTVEFYSAWFLSEIISANSVDTVKFTYEPGMAKYTTRIYGLLSPYLTLINNTHQCSKNIKLQTTYLLPPYTTSADFSNQSITHKLVRLKEIRHNKSSTSVKFTYSNREDLYGGKKLDQISVYYKTTNIQNWIFDYGYFTTTWEKNEIFPDLPTEILSTLNKRLKLNSIQKTGANNIATMSPYYFSYYNDDVNSKLPYRNCVNGFDHWGYFNMELQTNNDVTNSLKSFPMKTSTVSLPVSPQDGVYLLSSSENITNFNIVGYSTYIESYLIPQFNLGGDRRTNEEYVKSLSLKEIIFPTGGKTLFNYECNTYTSVWNSTQAGTTGGIRIKQIIDITDTDSIIKEYYYSGGVVYSLPNYIYTYYDLPYYGSHGKAFYLNNYSDSSPYSYSDKIGYSQVVEQSINRKTNQQYKTIYNYYSPIYYEIGCYQQTGVIVDTGQYGINQSNNLYSNIVSSRKIVRPFDVPILGKSYKYGLQKSVGYYKDNILIREEEYTYKNIAVDSIFANRIKYYNQWPFTVDCEYHSNLGGLYANYHFDIYFHETGRSFLKHKIVKQYDQNGVNPVIIKSKYEYDTNYELLRSVTDSIEDKVIKKEFEYPVTMGDFPYYLGNPHPFQVMTVKNMLDFLVTEKILVNGNTTNLNINLYEKNNNFIVLSSHYKLSTDIPLNNFTPLTKGNETTLYTIDPRMEQELSYTYYPNGKVKEIISHKTGITTTILWSYNSQYPVVELKGVKYENVVGPFGGSVLDLAVNINPTNNEINFWRSAYSSYQVTTYTYRPLVGMTSMTDPRGVTTHYDYDGFGRLKETYIFENGQKKVLQAYNYHYQQ